MLTIVSAAFYENHEPFTHMLVRSCARLGLPLSLYGHKQEGKSWRNMKAVQLLPHLDMITTEYVLYTDAGDSWLLQPEAEIMERFFERECEILISGERSLYPSMPEIAHAYPLAPTSLRYICAGGFMGKTKDVRRALALLLEYPDTDGNDQLLWHRLLLDKKMHISIDHYAEVFLSMSGIGMHEIVEGASPVFCETGTKPCVIHFNGGKGGSPNEQNMHRLWQQFEADML